MLLLALSLHISGSYTNHIACVCVSQCKLWISCYALSRGTLVWTDEASKRQEVSENCARKHQLYKQKGLNSVGQKPPLHGGLAQGFLIRKHTDAKRQNLNTSDISHNQCRFSYGQWIERVMVTITVITGHGQGGYNLNISSEQTWTWTYTNQSSCSLPPYLSRLIINGVKTLREFNKWY